MPAITRRPVTIRQFLNIDDLEKVVNQQIGLASCTVVWKKKCFDNIRFIEILAYAEEWECYLRIIAENYKGIIIDNILYYNRKHSNSNTNEFYRNNPIRRASKKEAVLLVVQNLNEKKILTTAILKHFVVQSAAFREFHLFQSIMATLNLRWAQKLKWQIFYITLPLQFAVSRSLKKIKKLLR
jgi:hypothetical protein